MKPADHARAVTAAVSTATGLGLKADDAVVLHDSNKVTLRLLPCDVLARVAPEADQSPEFEIELARRLAETDSPVAALDPRVEPRIHEHDGFKVTLWTYYAPAAQREVPPAAYADALRRLHAGMREVDVPTPHFTERIEHARRLVADRDRTPDLPDADRDLLAATLRTLHGSTAARGGPDQLLHGEPHPGNLLATKDGPLFVDLETCCRGPVAFDLAHAPEEVGDHYPGVDQDLLRACRILVLAMVTTWRWDRDDQFPDGRRLATEWLSRIRAAVDR